LSLELYDDLTTVWADKIAAKISYIFSAKLASVQFHNNNFASDSLIVTARYENEFAPIVKLIKWEAPPTANSKYFPQNKYDSGRMVLSDTQSVSAAILCVGEMGAAPSAAIVSQAINIYRPRVVAMVGMCCGFSSSSCSSPSKLGDVIVVRESASWEEG